MGPPHWGHPLPLSGSLGQGISLLRAMLGDWGRGPCPRARAPPASLLGGPGAGSLPLHQQLPSRCAPWNPGNPGTGKLMERGGRGEYVSLSQHKQ